MEKRHCEHSDLLLLCLTGDATAAEQARIQSHLTDCAACRAEWTELLTVWHSLPFELDEVEVPADLKQQVMTAIKAAQAGSAAPTVNHRQPASWSIWQIVRRWRTARLRIYQTATVLLAVLLAASWWQNRTLEHELAALIRPAPEPAQVIHVYPLVPFDPSTAGAKGRVLLLRQGDQDVLVFEVQDMKATQGSEAYQAWLIRDGIRTNAGVFVVDPQGNGLLTYVRHGEPISFDAIGITLEPDAMGQQPRGKKVLGTPL